MRYYVLPRPAADIWTEYLELPPHNVGAATRCPKCNAPTRSLPSLPPYNLELIVWDNRPGDIVFGTSTLLLISQNAKRVIEREDLKGLSGFSDVTIVRVKWRKKRLFLPRYYAGYPEYEGGRLDLQRSTVVREPGPVCSTCLLGPPIRSIKGIYIEDGSWNGADIFYATGMPGLVLVTERFREAATDAGLTGFQLTPADKYAFDFYAPL